jgi:hypothetical protein
MSLGMLEEGVIVGSDLSQEWLLPWWWDHYRIHNSYPVTFFDFGMSDPMKRWCAERGDVIRLGISSLFVKEREEIAPELVQRWEEDCGTKFWELRAGWFKKPSALIRTPYQKTIWIDLDCEIRGSLHPLFSSCDEQIALVEEPEGGVNSGVVAFPRTMLFLMQEWEDRSLQENGRYRGDQDILYALIQEKKVPFISLPLIYNWLRTWGDNPQAVIFHWHSAQGKTVIRYQIAKKLSGIL